MSERLRIGFIPLVDAAALIVAADKGFCAAEGLDVELVREISWANVRDKFNIGLFDAAHLLAPLAVASSLGIGHVKVPVISGFGLGVNGNAITVSPDLHAAIVAMADGDVADPLVSGRALARVVAERRAKGQEPLTFGMTFPFSSHNYDLRFWMGAGGIDPDEDVRLVVLPPPSWWRVSPASISTASASARRGIRWRSILASAPSCISPANCSSAPPRRC